MPNRDTNKEPLGSLHRKRGFMALAARLRLSKHTGTYLTVSIMGPFIVNGEEGSALTFCDLGCFNTFSFYQDTAYVTSGKPLVSGKGVCFYCAACGRRIFKNRKCVIHENKCPDYLWITAVPTVDDFQTAMKYYLKVNELPQNVWDTADKIAANNHLLAGIDLAKLTIEELGLA
jgi:hypothetical protein